MLKINGHFSDSALVCILHSNYRNHKPVFQGFGAQPDHSGGNLWINIATPELQNPDRILISRSAGMEIFPHLYLIAL